MICRCSKLHPACQESTTLLVPNMFASLGFMEMMLDERDSDVALEVIMHNIVCKCMGHQKVTYINSHGGPVLIRIENCPDIRFPVVNF